ncbi:MAG: prepilin-type N-terminal cleavage/methylation domain-containing protein [Candidatus Pacebacteria bacterium]|nr:prepilin-type N-terminal cleavage/methylation domain-containing protein [Candidatus Paceibacterota bacterium]
MFSKKLKSFTLIELLVVIALITTLSSIVIVIVSRTRTATDDMKARNNRSQAAKYCAINPGVSTLFGDSVYCDSDLNMWSVTLNTALGEDKLKLPPNSGADTYYWSYPNNEDIVTLYSTNDCNEVPIEDMSKFPACNACRTLNYAGFSEGWRLPTQAIPVRSSTNCGTSCARDAVYCAEGRQLWNLGAENCSNWGATACSASQGSCLPSYDPYAVSGNYWSSTQVSATNAWWVNFNNGYVLNLTKSTNLLRVRCFLGQ